LEEALKGNISPGDEVLYQKVVDRDSGVVTRRPYLIKKRALMTGTCLPTQGCASNRISTNPMFRWTFDARGARLFDQITAENVRKRLAIVLDNNVYSAPVIQERISGWEGRRSPGLSPPEEASDLAIVFAPAPCLLR